MRQQNDPRAIHQPLLRSTLPRPLSQRRCLLLGKANLGSPSSYAPFCPINCYLRKYILAAILSHVEARQISNGTRSNIAVKAYQIPSTQVHTGTRGAKLRIEARLDGTVVSR